LLIKSGNVSRVRCVVLGRTIPSWRMVMKDEVKKLNAFRKTLREDDKRIFDDLLLQCELYAPDAGSMASVVKEVPLIMSMLFGQHKRLMKLEKHIMEDSAGAGTQIRTD